MQWMAGQDADHGTMVSCQPQRHAYHGVRVFCVWDEGEGGLSLVVFRQINNLPSECTTNYSILPTTVSRQPLYPANH